MAISIGSLFWLLVPVGSRGSGDIVLLRRVEGWDALATRVALARMWTYEVINCGGLGGLEGEEAGIGVLRLSER